jgi:hypothetical protein
VTNWLPDIDFDDLVRIDILRVELDGSARAGVAVATCDLYLRDGRVVRHDIACDGIANDTLRDRVDRFNRSRGGGRPGRADRS